MMPVHLIITSLILPWDLMLIHIFSHNCTCLLTVSLWMQAMATWLKWDRRKMRAMERCYGRSKRSGVEGKIRSWYRLWETKCSRGQISDISSSLHLNWFHVVQDNILPSSYCVRKCLFFYLTFSAAGLLFFVSWWVFLGDICFSTSASPQDRQGQVYGSGRQALPSLKAHTHTQVYRQRLTDRQTT